VENRVQVVQPNKFTLYVTAIHYPSLFTASPALLEAGSTPAFYSSCVSLFLTWSGSGWSLSFLKHTISLTSGERCGQKVVPTPVWIYGSIIPVTGLSGCFCTMQMLIVYQICLNLVLVVMDRMGMKLPTWYLLQYLSCCSCTMQKLIVYQTCLYLVLVVMDRMGVKLPTWYLLQYLSCSPCRITNHVRFCGSFQESWFSIVWTELNTFSLCFRFDLISLWLIFTNQYGCRGSLAILQFCFACRFW